MNRLFNKLKNIFGIIIILIILASYFGVYIPLKAELEDSLHSGFKAVISNSEIILENHINRAVEDAEGLASRTMIAAEIERYNAGEISFAELQQYTQPKYEQGAAVYKHLLAAYRFVDNRLLASYGRKHSWFLDEINLQEDENNNLIITDDQNYIIAQAPVINQEAKIIGRDYIIYDLTEIILELKALNSEEINYNILSGKTELESGIHSGQVIELRELNNTGYFLKAETSASLIYDTISRISYKIMLIIFATIIIISFLVIKILHDASENVVNNLKEELKEKTILSETDKMLGIYNRAKFNKELKREMDRAQRYYSDLALIMIDIDYFKEFNDNYGHQVGDRILKKIVAIIKQKIRKHDILARYGGDEFMLICPETTLGEAEKLAQRLNIAIDDYNCGQNNDLSCSFGVAEFKIFKDEEEDLISRADQALYKAKENGRNRVCRNNS